MKTGHVCVCGGGGVTKNNFLLMWVTWSWRKQIVCVCVLLRLYSLYCVCVCETPVVSTTQSTSVACFWRGKPNTPSRCTLSVPQPLYPGYPFFKWCLWTVSVLQWYTPTSPHPTPPHPTPFFLNRHPPHTLSAQSSLPLQSAVKTVLHIH